MPRAYCCPFWLHEREKCIYCEAGKLIFSDRAEFIDYVNRYCSVNPGWKHCTLAQSLNASYERRMEQEASPKGEYSGGHAAVGG